MQPNRCCWVPALTCPCLPTPTATLQTPWWLPPMSMNHCSGGPLCSPPAVVEGKASQMLLKPRCRSNKGVRARYQQPTFMRSSARPCASSCLSGTRVMRSRNWRSSSRISSTTAAANLMAHPSRTACRQGVVCASVHHMEGLMQQ